MNITPRAAALNGISLRISESSILATLPATLYGHKTRAAIYGIKGNKLLKVAKTESQGQIEVPISGIPKGRYLLEIRSPNQGNTKASTSRCFAMREQLCTKSIVQLKGLYASM